MDRIVNGVHGVLRELGMKAHGPKRPSKAVYLDSDGRR